MFYRITMDGTAYRVRVRHDSLFRSFELLSGPNAGVMLSGQEERDLLGTSYSYTLSVEPDSQYPEDYDAFFQAVSAPVESHRIAMPYGQGILEFEAMAESGRDGWHGKIGGKNRWYGLQVQFRPIEPQREA